MKQTGLFLEHIKLGAKMTPFAGFDMPLYYTSITDEHLAVREHVGIFDVSHMGQIYIKGPDALRFVNKIVTNTIKPTDWKATYALLLNQEGCILDDLLVYVYNPENIVLVVNASNIDIDYHHILSVFTDEDITIENQSEHIMQVAIQGPKALDNVKKIFNESLEDLSFMTFKTINYLDSHIMISRTGYTGEDGFEIYGLPHEIKDLFNKSLSFGAIPCGLGARDTLRFEANLPLYGHEITKDMHPYASGLKFAVKADKDFVGKDALLANNSHQTHKIFGLEMQEKGIPRQGYRVLKEEKDIGYITTGYLLPHQKRALALAYLNKEGLSMGDTVLIKIRNKTFHAKIRDRKFYTKKYVK